MSKRFERNCELFGHKNPRAAALLSFADPGTLKILRNDNGEHNLVDNFYYHSQSGAKEEANIWAKSLPLQGVKVLVVFGLGLGYLHAPLIAWLREDKARTLIFLEDDLRVILHFLESEYAKPLLQDPQVQIFHIEDSEEGLHVLQGISWGAFGKEMLITALPAYKKFRKKVFDEIETRLRYETSDIHAVLDEYVIYGVTYFRNFWKNLFLIPGSALGNNLTGAFRGCPAIIVGAGPSLAKHLEKLKHLRDHALIFSGGSSVNALVEAGIVPHFGAGIDPNAMQYLRLRQGLAYQVPYFYRTRLLHEAAQLITGPRLYLKGGDGYNISDWFERRLGIKGAILGGGHSIANFQIEIAHVLGCSPIILVGFDLAYGKELQVYAPGVEATPAPQTFSGQDEVVPWKNQDGAPVNTAWKWLVEAKWIEDFVKDHPRMKLINATEGGLGVQGVPHMSLDDAARKYLTSTRDLDALVHTAIQDAGTCNADFAKLFKGCAEIYDSLERVKKYLDELALHLGKKRAFSREDPHTILLEGKLKKEAAYRYILEVFDRMRTKLEHYELEFTAHPTIKDKERKRLEAELLMKRYVFLKKVAMVNQLLIAQSISLQHAKGLDISTFLPKAEVVWT